MPAYRAHATLPALLDALEPQVQPGRHEVFVVDSTESDAPTVAYGRWPYVNLVRLDQRALPGRARNIGAQRADAELLAFIDADAIPSTGWLSELLESLTPDLDAVAGAVLNGTPHSRIGTAGYYLEFSDWLPVRRGRLLHAATCNLIIRHSALDHLGGFAEDLPAGEDTVLTLQLGRRARLGFAPQATVIHRNRTGRAEYLRQQRLLGRGFVAVCQRSDFPHGTFARPSLAWAAVLLRLAALMRRVWRSPSDLAHTATVLPWILLGLLAWARGISRSENDGAIFR